LEDGVRPQVVEVIRAVEAVTGVPAYNIASKDGHKSVAAARALAYWLCRHHGVPPLPMSYPEIGREMGCVHTSVLTGVRRFQRLLDRGDEWACDVKRRALMVLRGEASGVRDCGVIDEAKKPAVG
jgi:chromosomal replication initiation ATPase DnaA